MSFKNNNRKGSFTAFFLFYGIKLAENFTFTKKCNIMSKWLYE